MARAGHDDHLLFTTQARVCLPVELDHLRIEPADDKQGRRFHAWERFTSKIRTAAARDNCADLGTEIGCRYQCCAAAGARAEIPNPQLARGSLPLGPPRRVGKSLSEQSDVESKMAGPCVERFLVCREQVEEKRSEPCGTNAAGHELVARAVPAAAGAVSEKHDSFCRGRK